MDVILSKFSDFKYLKIKMTLDLVPELCSVKGVVVISQTKSECILKIPRDFVFETLESINKLVDIEDFEISNSFFRKKLFYKTILQKRSTIEKRNVYYSDIISIYFEL